MVIHIEQSLRPEADRQLEYFLVPLARAGSCGGIVIRDIPFNDTDMARKYYEQSRKLPIWYTVGTEKMYVVFY